MPIRRDLPPIPPVPKLPRAIIAKLNKHLAKDAQELARLARKFARLDVRYKPHLDWDWREVYEQMLESAECIQDDLRAPRTDEERALLAWSKQISPSKGQLARKPWTRLEGLSPRYEAWQLALEEALFRMEQATIPFMWVTYRRFQNPGFEHQAICETYKDASGAAHKAVNSIWLSGTPKTPADRLLIRRAIELKCFGLTGFSLHFRRAVRRREREQGQHLPERQIPRDERLVMYVVDYHPSMKFPLEI